MKLLDVTPMLTVAAMAPAIAFYRDILNFTLMAETEAWACLSLDGVEVMLTLPNAHLAFDRPTFTGSLYFNVDDVDPLWHRLRDQCQIVYPLDTFPYGMKEFAVRDNSGYLLQFGQSID